MLWQMSSLFLIEKLIKLVSRRTWYGGPRAELYWKNMVDDSNGLPNAQHKPCVYPESKRFRLASLLPQQSIQPTHSRPPPYKCLVSSFFALSFFIVGFSLLFFTLHCPKTSFRTGKHTKQKFPLISDHHHRRPAAHLHPLSLFIHSFIHSFIHLFTRILPPPLRQRATYTMASLGLITRFMLAALMGFFFLPMAAGPPTLFRSEGEKKDACPRPTHTRVARGTQASLQQPPP